MKKSGRIRCIFQSKKQCKTIFHFLSSISFAGFTLSEVLITIVIIGIVASITIPIFKGMVQQAVLNSQFKKAYSTFTNAFAQIKAHQGDVSPCYYGINGAANNVSGCTAFYAQLKSELKILKYCSSDSYNKGCIPMYNGLDTIDPDITQAQKDYWGVHCSGFTQFNILHWDPAFVLSDGTIIFAYNGNDALFAVDVNGFKQPNKWGYDLFGFVIQGDGNILKVGGTSISCIPTEGGKTSLQMLLGD